MGNDAKHHMLVLRLSGRLIWYHNNFGVFMFLGAIPMLMKIINYLLYKRCPYCPKSKSLEVLASDLYDATRVDNCVKANEIFREIVARGKQFRTESERKLSDRGDE